MVKCNEEKDGRKCCVVVSHDTGRVLYRAFYDEHGGRSGARSVAQRKLKELQRRKGRIKKNKQAIYDYWRDQGGMPMSRAEELVQKALDARERDGDIVEQIIEKVLDQSGFLPLIRKQEPVEKSIDDPGFRGPLYERAGKREADAVAKSVQDHPVIPLPTPSPEKQGWINLVAPAPASGDRLLEQVSKTLKGQKGAKAGVDRALAKWKEAVDTWVREARPSLFGIRFELWPPKEKKAFNEAMAKIPEMVVIMRQVDEALNTTREPGDLTLTAKSLTVLDFMTERVEKAQDDVAADLPADRRDGLGKLEPEAKPEPKAGDLPGGWDKESVKAYWENDMGGSQETCLANCPATVKDKARFCERLQAAAGGGKKEE